MFGYELSTAASVATTLAAIALVVEAARRANWSDGFAGHLRWALATAFVLLGHRMSVRLATGLELHYLGAAFLALLLGYPRALVSMAIVFVADALLPAARASALVPLSHWGVRMLIAGVLPVVAIWSIVAACRRWLPRNLFVFLLGCGFFGLFVAYAIELAVAALVFAAVSPALPGNFTDDFVPYSLLLAAGESWLEGMLTTVLVVYVPGSVRLFDESFYLSKR